MKTLQRNFNATMFKPSAVSVFLYIVTLFSVSSGAPAIGKSFPRMISTLFILYLWYREKFVSFDPLNLWFANMHIVKRLIGSVPKIDSLSKEF